MSGRAAHARSRFIAIAPAAAALASLACGDRAPPALWPEPPPPTLAAPIGIDEATGEGEMRPGDATSPEAESPEQQPRSKLPPRPATTARPNEKAGEVAEPREPAPREAGR